MAKGTVAGAVRAGTEAGTTSETAIRRMQDRLGPAGARLLKAAAARTTTEAEMNKVASNMGRNAIKLMQGGMSVNQAVSQTLADLRATPTPKAKVKAKAKAKKRPTRRPR